MRFSDAFDALVTMLDELDEIDAVLRGTVAAAAELGVDAVVAVLPPAGRRTERHSSPDRTVTWSQEVLVLCHVAGADSAAMVAAMDDVAAATLAVDAALDTQITFGGRAVVVGPFTWQSGDAVEIPPESGQLFAGQSGTCEIVLIHTGTRGA